jgi:hypothetical protein
MIKYLKGFQWSDLMNQQLHHKKLRDQRLRQHVDFAKRQANFYLDNVEKQQEYEKRQDKKRKREDDDKGSDEESPAPAPAPAPAPVKLNENTIKRTFQQRDVTANKEDEDELDDGFFAQVRTFQLISLSDHTRSLIQAAFVAIGRTYSYAKSKEAEGRELASTLVIIILYIQCWRLSFLPVYFLTTINILSGANVSTTLCYKHKYDTGSLSPWSRFVG